MSHVNNDELFDRVTEDVLDNVEYEAVLKYDGEVIARISSYSVSGLEEQLRKLEHAEEKLINDEFHDRFENGYYEPDYDEINKDQ